MTWNTEKYGPAEDYGIVDQQSFDGFTIGDKVEARRDHDEDEFFLGETGEVIGVSKTEAGMFGPGGTKLVVAFDDQMDPVHVAAPDRHLEKL